MAKPNAVLIIGAGILQTYLIKEAKAMGLAVVAVDGNPNAPGFVFADAHSVMSTYDVETVASAIPSMQERFHLIGVCTAGADVAPTVALAAQAAGVPGIPYGVAKNTHDKGIVRLLLDKAGLSGYQPRFELMSTDEPFSAFHACIDKIGGYPVVFKPRTQRASRGVSIVTSEAEIAPAVDKLRAYGQAFLIEEHLEGTEHSAEMIFVDHQDFAWANIVDRIFQYDQGIPIEIGHVNPTILPHRDQSATHAMMLKAAEALGVNFGAFKCDVMMTEDGPKILECTARLSGGFDSQVTSPLTGRHPMRTLLELSCGMPITERWTYAEGYAACAAILPKKYGILRAWPTEMMNSLCIPIAKIGERIVAPTNAAERCGYVIESHACIYESVWALAKDYADHIAEHMDIAEE